MALLHPDIATIYCAMSVPYNPRPENAPLPMASMRGVYGDERAYDKVFLSHFSHVSLIFLSQFSHVCHVSLIDEARDEPQLLLCVPWQRRYSAFVAVLSDF